MKKEEARVTVSCLTTEEDYIHFKLAVHRAKQNKTEASLLRLGGFLLAAFGAAGSLLWGRGNFTHTFFWLLLVLFGLTAAFSPDVIEPYLIKKRGKSRYALEKNRMVAQKVFFCEDTVSFSTDRYEAGLPYELLYACAEDGEVFLLFLGLEEIRFVPKRALSEEDCEFLRTLLRKKLGKHFLELKTQG